MNNVILETPYLLAKMYKPGELKLIADYRMAFVRSVLASGEASLHEYGGKDVKQIFDDQVQEARWQKKYAKESLHAIGQTERYPRFYYSTGFSESRLTTRFLTEWFSLRCTHQKNVNCMVPRAVSHNGTR